MPPKDRTGVSAVMEKHAGPKRMHHRMPLKNRGQFIGGADWEKTGGAECQRASLNPFTEKISPFGTRYPTGTGSISVKIPIVLRIPGGRIFMTAANVRG